MRRLSFRPAEKEMHVTDVKTGHFLFRPREDRPARFAELRREVVNQGYDVQAAMIEVRGTVGPDARLTSTGTAQVFALSGERVAELTAAASRAAVDVVGHWRGDEEGEVLEVTSWNTVE